MRRHAALFQKDFATNMFERKMTWQAKSIYPWLCQIVCYHGTVEYNLMKLYVDVFDGEMEPAALSIKEFEAALAELKANSVIERWTANGREWLFITRYPGENSFKLDTKPDAPRPPSLRGKVTESDWSAGKTKPLFKKLRKASKTFGKFTLEGDVDGDVEGDLKTDVSMGSVKEVWSYYLEKIQPDPTRAKLLDANVTKIKARLKTFTVDELKKAIDNKVADGWWMKRNRGKTAAWFFASDIKTDAYINGKAVSETKVDPGNQIDE